MKYIKRNIEDNLKQKFFSGKAIIVYGPRQCGKTTMIKHLVQDLKNDVLWLNGDNPDTKNLLTNISLSRWQLVIGKHKTVVVDEAQNIENIGNSLKLVIDEMPHIQVIATGSSSFELMNKTAEPLTGRKFEYKLLPFSFAELCDEYGFFEEKQQRERRLLFGCYPDIVANPGEERQRLEELAGSYLFKDIYALDGLRKTSLIEKIVTALALQIGSEVNCNELASLVGTDNKTVERYLDLLYKCYVVFPLRSFSRNLRNEIKKSFKVYFYDLGIRNAVINNFSPLASRTDAGGMWENYLISERLKKNLNIPFRPNMYFWRTRAPQNHEIDYIEEKDGTVSAYEFKSNPASKAKIPLTFINAYQTASTEIITPENYEYFLN